MPTKDRFIARVIAHCTSSATVRRRCVRQGIVRIGKAPSPSRFAARPWLPMLGAAYLLLGGGGLAMAWAFDAHAFVCTPWLTTSGSESIAVSIAMGLASSALIIFASRKLEQRADWARALHAKLRPFVRHESNVILAAIAIASGVSEEIFFRGFLSQTIGIVLSSIAFGIVHQVRGRGRWGWMLSAAALGAWMAILFSATGQLIGPIVAHVAINAANLRRLRDHDVEPVSRKNLGGLLARRS